MTVELSTFKYLFLMVFKDASQFHERQNKYRFMKDYRYLYSIEKMCRVLELSSCRFYHWHSVSQTARAQRKLELVDEIRSIYRTSHSMYANPIEPPTNLDKSRACISLMYHQNKPLFLASKNTNWPCKLPLKRTN